LHLRALHTGCTRFNPLSANNCTFKKGFYTIKNGTVRWFNESNGFSFIE
jgi:hypothetical protein